MAVFIVYGRRGVEPHRFDPIRDPPKPSWVELDHFAGFRPLFGAAAASGKAKEQLGFFHFWLSGRVTFHLRTTPREELEDDFEIVVHSTG